MTLESIRIFVVPCDLADVTDAQLRAAGLEGVERFVLWSGIVIENTFQVETAHVPRQKAYRGARGLYVEVDGDELHRLNVWLFQNHQQLGVQVHSHPTNAFHSDTDDAYPMVTVRGGLSIVVPDFGGAGIRGGGVVAYRLGLTGWDEVASDAMQHLLRFEECR